MNLANKICMITGCNRGIGKAIVQEFASNGAIVLANGRNESAVNNMITEIRENDPDSKIFPFVFDVTNHEDMKREVKRIKEEYGSVDVLVNNAAQVKDGYIGLISRATMEEVFDTNLYSVIDLTQQVVKLMKKRPYGCIINISSVVGIEGNIGQSIYSASKGAIISFTKTAAKELAPYNIRVNAIAPGFIDTDMLEAISEEQIENIKKRIIMNRFGTAKEVADVCVFLASDYASYITGEVIRVDGGIEL